MIETQGSKLTLDVTEFGSKLILAEYERITALERARLEFMEKILQSHITVASVVVAGTLLIAEKGPDLGIPFSMADALLTGLLAFGVITLFRTVNSNVALMELARRLEVLRRFFTDQDSEPKQLQKYFFTGLIEESDRLRNWASVKGITARGLARGGDKDTWL